MFDLLTVQMWTNAKGDEAYIDHDDCCNVRDDEGHWRSLEGVLGVGAIADPAAALTFAGYRPVASKTIGLGESDDPTNVVASEICDILNRYNGDLNLGPAPCNATMIDDGVCRVEIGQVDGHTSTFDIIVRQVGN